MRRVITRKHDRRATGDRSGGVVQVKGHVPGFLRRSRVCAERCHGHGARRIPYHRCVSATDAATGGPLCHELATGPWFELSAVLQDCVWTPGTERNRPDFRERPDSTVIIGPTSRRIGSGRSGPGTRQTTSSFSMTVCYRHRRSVRPSRRLRGVPRRASWAAVPPLSDSATTEGAGIQDGRWIACRIASSDEPGIPPRIHGHPFRSGSPAGRKPYAHMAHAPRLAVTSRR
jgi:hypothetical protein